jgi:hypothetical protein
LDPEVVPDVPEAVVVVLGEDPAEDIATINVLWGSGPGWRILGLGDGLGDCEELCAVLCQEAGDRSWRGVDATLFCCWLVASGLASVTIIEGPGGFETFVT